MTSDEALNRPDVAEWELERFAVGELPPADMERLAGLVARDARLRLRLDALAQSSEAILEETPPRAFAAAVRERLERDAAPVASRRGAARYAWSGAVAAAAATAVLVVVLPRHDPAPAPVPVPGAARDVTRVKGLTPRLEVFRQTASGPEVLSDGSPARLDDVVQIAYQAGGQRFGVIASLDGRGVVTVHFPTGGADAAPLSSGKVALPAAYRLDDAPLYERFYLVTSNEPFAVAQVVDAARKAGGHNPAASRLVLPPSMKQASLGLTKVSVP